MIQREKLCFFLNIIAIICGLFLAKKRINTQLYKSSIYVLLVSKEIFLFFSIIKNREKKSLSKEIAIKKRVSVIFFSSIIKLNGSLQYVGMHLDSLCS